MVKFWQKLVYPVLPILLAVLTWYIQLMVPDGDIWPFNSWEWTKYLYPGFFKFRIQIGAGATLFVVVAFFISGFLGGRHQRRKLFDKIFHQIFKEKLKGDYSKFRLTLFYPRNPIYMIYLWVKKTFINGLAHINRGCFWIHFMEFPWPWRKYISIEYRMGHPHEKNSTTYFRIPDREEDFDGFASHIWYRKSPDKITLPDIRNLDLQQNSNMNNFATRQRNLIKRYMTQGRVTNYRKLRMIHRLPIHLWRSPLLDKEQVNVGGVLILDSTNESADIFVDGLDEDLVSFSRMLETVIGAF